jgi:hypothetical protein
MNVMSPTISSETVCNSKPYRQMIDGGHSKFEYAASTICSGVADPSCARYEQTIFPGDESIMSASSATDPSSCVPRPIYVYSFLGSMRQGGDVSHRI